MAEAVAAVGDEAGTRSTSSGSRRSQRGDYRRRRQRHCSTLTSAAVGTADDTGRENLDHAVATDDEPAERVLHRRGAVRERRRRYMDVDGPATLDRFHRRPLFEENLMMGEPMMLDRIDGLNDAWDAGRFVAVLRQRRDLLFGVTEHDLINALIGDDGFGMGERAEYVFPVGESRFTECFICMEYKNLHLRTCCNLAACDDCLRTYLSTQVEQAIIKIQCIGTDCSSLIHRDEIIARLVGADKARYAQFLVDANCDPLCRTCPRCSHVLTVDGQLLVAADKHGLMVTCAECQLDWCFPCHAPWHAHMKCSEFRRGDRLLKAWAREQHYGQVNAQKCPKCKFYIQRSSGCDHMTCSRCKTDFCYRCGERFRELKFVGNHYSKLSIFGCKYRFKPTQPVQRRLIRGSIFAAQLMAVPALGALALGAGAVVASVGSLVLPFYAGYKLHKRLERRRSAKRRRRAREAMWRKLEDMRWRGEELDISHPMLTELDTSQIIRSYIGVELAAMDGNVSTSDDAESGLNGSNRDFYSGLDMSSSTDDDEDDLDDVSLHIRDEACQTRDDDNGNSASESRRVGLFPMLSDRQMKVGGDNIPSAAAYEEMSVWRTLLHNDDTFQSVDIDVDDPSCCGKQIVGITCGSVLEAVADDGKVSSGREMLCESRRHFIRSQSDSSLLSSVSRKIRTPPAIRNVVSPLNSGSSSGPISFQVDLCRSETSAEEMTVRWKSLCSLTAVDQPRSAFIAQPTDECRGLSRRRETPLMSDVVREDPVTLVAPGRSAEEMSVSRGSLSDVMVALQSDLPGDAVSLAAGNQRTTTDIHVPATAFVDGTPFGADNLRVKSGVVCHPAGLMCMDHQVCSLLADFVVHL